MMFKELGIDNSEIVGEIFSDILSDVDNVEHNVFTLETFVEALFDYATRINKVLQAQQIVKKP